MLEIEGDEWLVLRGLSTGGVVAVPGDANGDGDVDAGDLTLFEAQFGGTPPGVDSCDFDADGDVDLDDFAVLRGNFTGGGGGAPLPGGKMVATPEPATMSVLALCGLVLLKPRRQK